MISPRFISYNIFLLLIHIYVHQIHSLVSILSIKNCGDNYRAGFKNFFKYIWVFHKSSYPRLIWDCLIQSMYTELLHLSQFISAPFILRNKHLTRMHDILKTRFNEKIPWWMWKPIIILQSCWTFFIKSTTCRSVAPWNHLLVGWQVTRWQHDLQYK